MGNCQAVDNATVVIQHQNGKVEKLFFPVAAGEVMKTNPGHYVALLLTTTFYSADTAAGNKDTAAPLKVTRIKLLRPTDTLVLGHVYRIVSSQEVMKGLWAKKQANMQQQQQNGNMKEKQIPDFEGYTDGIRERIDRKKSNIQVHQRSRNNIQVNTVASKSRAWQPALRSISEAAI